MKKLTDKSLRSIGDYLGGRDHATVMHAIERIRESLSLEPEVRQLVNTLEKEIAA
jgi:chromosomal replication initiator protein